MRSYGAENTTEPLSFLQMSPAYVLFSLLPPHLLTPDNSPNKKIVFKKDVKENRTFQERCQRKLLNEVLGQHGARVEEGDKGAV